MYKFILILILVLSGCSSGGPLPRTMNRQTMTITWVRTQPSMAGGPLCKDKMTTFAGQNAIMRAKGCEEQTGPDTCTIWLVEPTDAVDDKQMAVLGHEVLHCFLGAFHN